MALSRATGILTRTFTLNGSRTAAVRESVTGPISVNLGSSNCCLLFPRQRTKHGRRGALRSAKLGSRHEPISKFKLAERSILMGTVEAGDQSRCSE